MNHRKLLRSMPRHPLFRAMVLMGNGIAVGCGGTTITGRGEVGDGTGGGGGPGDAGTTGNGGLTGGTGGTELSAAGGATNDPSPPLPLPCPPSQYDCSAIRLSCGVTGNGWSFDATCKCNPQRPRSAADCTTTQSFVCRDGTTTANGAPLQTAVPFECSCVPMSPDCGAACSTTFKGPRMACSDAPDGAVVCGCAFIGLK